MFALRRSLANAAASRRLFFTRSFSNQNSLSDTSEYDESPLYANMKRNIQLLHSRARSYMMATEPDSGEDLDEEVGEIMSVLPLKADMSGEQRRQLRALVRDFMVHAYTDYDGHQKETRLLAARMETVLIEYLDFEAFGEPEMRVDCVSSARDLELAMPMKAPPARAESYAEVIGAMLALLRNDELNGEVAEFVAQAAAERSSIQLNHWSAQKQLAFQVAPTFFISIDFDSGKLKMAEMSVEAQAEPLPDQFIWPNQGACQISADWLVALKKHKFPLQAKEMHDFVGFVDIEQ